MGLQPGAVHHRDAANLVADLLRIDIHPGPGLQALFQKVTAAFSGLASRAPDHEIICPGQKPRIPGQVAGPQAIKGVPGAAGVGAGHAIRAFPPVQQHLGQLFHGQA